MKGQILFNLLFWIPNSFCTFHDYARGVIPFLASHDGHWIFIIKIFEQLSCSETFHYIEIFIFFQDFWAICGLPWKTEYALKSLYWMYFLSFRILNNLRLPWKTEFVLKFFNVSKYFYLTGFLSNLSLPWKQCLLWIFQAGGAAVPRLVRHCLSIYRL